MQRTWQGRRRVGAALLVTGLMGRGSSTTPPRPARDVAVPAEEPVAPAPDGAIKPPPQQPPPTTPPADGPAGMAVDAAAPRDAGGDAPAERPRDAAAAPATDARAPTDALARYMGMTFSYTLPDGGTALLPACVHNGWMTDLSCTFYCSCWFDKGHCTTYPATANVYATPDDCMKACSAFVADKGIKALQCHAYRTDNDDFHCPAGVLGARCP